MTIFHKRKAFGQHFLVDQTISNRIAEKAVEEAEKASCAALLEIGPGRGAITDPLVNRLNESKAKINTFIICEKDRKLAADWKIRFNEPREDPNIIIHEADFLNLDEKEWLSKTPLAVASNLPYSVGTVIVNRLAKHRDKIAVMVLMLQAEVAQRLRAEPRTKEWGSLSIWIQNHWEVKKLISVPPRAFRPPPKVDSEVIIMKPRPAPLIPVSPEQEVLWEKLLKVAFSHRRKMLRSGLPGTGQWRNALEQSQVDGTKRPEALDWPEWQRLFEALQKLSPEVKNVNKD